MDELTLAYFSMEFGIDPAIPTYSGGLGILAGDTIRAAADLGLPAVGVTLLERKGFFRQYLNSSGEQSESDCDWLPEEHLERLAPRVKVTIAGEPVWVQAWRYQVTGESGHTVPVYFLDTYLPENTLWNRGLTDHLYGGDVRYRLCQEVILGYAGVALLRTLGHRAVEAYHMNEGHSALTILALLEEQTWGRGLGAMESADREAVTRHCVFTTHTPLPVGHDVFPLDLVREVLGDERTDFLVASNCCGGGALNMTSLALNFSRYVNGVSMRHEEVARSMHANHRIDAITNGVHAVTWTSDPFQRLYDRHIPQWRRDNLYLKYAIRIPAAEIWQTHNEAKRELLDEVTRRTGVRLAPHIMTIGFARRAAEYKRHNLFFSDPECLKRLVREVGPLQIIYGGKAHPRDGTGKAIIKQVFEAASALKEFLPVVYLEEYDMALARYLCSGVDLWLNTPQKPQEASGTSGMKAALNGVPTLSILDGWWIEGHIEGVTGWAIGDGWQSAPDTAGEVASLYDKLEMVIMPLYYHIPEHLAQVMRSVIALNGSYFNTQRMIRQYLQNAYLASL
ncbi:MAG: alpha-glucan family phosphorylase [Chloroflexota bacterium]